MHKLLALVILSKEDTALAMVKILHKVTRTWHDIVNAELEVLDSNKLALSLTYVMRYVRANGI